ncbi:T9SS type A sorting domain-containing protein [Polaribacter sp. PL03]|uniref:T9SS type A sorting domain-containing protein n=1 Tax=Polaribacter sp. PL03 TaxID=3088353 RepID=UPI0029D10852|nr:T9SS type A sorting domain-containing protein [Polaribacter sp. PL03]MDX6747906.1 T9SS type A sorting domain-containing protein [Polaribacter sp. PL03]
MVKTNLYKRIFFSVLPFLCFCLLLSFFNNLNGQILPLSDIQNTGNWILNTNISDEFSINYLDENHWFIQGRASSQFSTEKIRLENGKLKIQTNWGPKYNFNPQVVNDGLRVRIEAKDISTGSSTMYIDDIFIKPTNTLNVDSFLIDLGESIVYPNSINKKEFTTINISSKKAKELFLHNINGVQLLKMNKTTEPFAVPIANLSSSVYFLTVISN